ncbi:hypothetical protein ACFQ7M_36100 [Streptomyces massasporeus]
MSPTSITMTGYGVSPGVAWAPLARMTPPVIPDPDEAPGENRRLAAAALDSTGPAAAHTSAQEMTEAFRAAAPDGKGL